MPARKNRPNASAPVAIAIGVFDGVHRGHREVLKKTLEAAKQLGGPAAALTFHPHPSKIAKTRDVRLMDSLAGRVEKIADCGISEVFVKRFDADFSRKTPEDFVKYLKRRFPRLKAIVTGANFHFGRRAEGSAPWLEKNAHKFGLEYFCVPGLQYAGQRISSSRLRAALESGSMGLFEKLSGAPYRACGSVRGGKKLGAKLGFPTLNLSFTPQCRPPYGVYFSKLTRRLKSGKVESFFGVSNYGLNPSVSKIKTPLLETNLFEAPKFGEGAQICVELLQFLRPEKKFDSLEELKKQISKDKEKAGKLSKK